MGDGAALLRSNTLYQTVGMTSTDLGLQLQAERTQSSMAISSRILTSGIGQQRDRTDRAVEKFRQAAFADDSGSPELRASLNTLMRQLDRLQDVRVGIDSGRHSRLDVLSNYNEILDAVFLLYDQMVAVPDLSIYQQAAAMQSMAGAREMIARENALISGALIDSRLSAGERDAFAGYAATRHYLQARGLSALDTTLGKPYRDTFNSTAFDKFTALEKAIVSGSGRRLPPEATQWRQTTNGLAVWLDELGAASSKALAERSQSVATWIMVRIAVAGGMGLVAVIASIIISVRFGRRLAGELAGLRSAALDLADVRLPEVVERLRRGEEVDVRAEAPPISADGSAEIHDVAQAFDSVQRTAVEAAVGQARLRRGVSQVFVNLARRKQSLLQRQLMLLDNMQRRATDSDSLDDLFRLDHLTTRMRRHAEGLIILSGAAPGRAWRNPVAVVDIVRAAIAEVEDYTRVSVALLPDAALDGAAVADITHLLAELVENATIYSPPQTTVTVRGDIVANGFAVEVEDRGLGLSAEEYEAINRRLEGPPDFDPADSDQLGLFVVGQLAARHGIQVVLRGSPFGGTTAIVLIPRALLAENPTTLTLTAERVVERPSELFEPGVPSALAAAPASSAAASASVPASGGGLPRRSRAASHAGPPASQPPVTPALSVVADLPPRGPVDKAAGEPAREPVRQPVHEPTRETVREPARQPVREPVREPFREPARQPVHEPAREPFREPARENAGPAGPAGPPGPKSLPRRVRQANLMPQLRQESETAAPAPEPKAAERSPDEARALFSAFQAGVRRGREEHGNDSAHQTTGDKGD
ncbi:nitrate- and nitrite sensing domain-containing protein [Streptosporangium sp. NPDC006007]|uniref:nitrate- and nitrite sensing domain-containing protein n=1 Tax=Streptosporangium sp. NPDC006007 TaxID=3154575 RepID=UPI0033AFF07A